MITEHLAGSQLPSNKTETFKSILKICQKDECEEPCILRGKFCEKHRTKNTNKKCQKEGCTKRPHFNFENRKPLFCSEHKENNMIDVINKKCKFEKCNKTPSFNFEGKKPIYCNDHKKDDMIDVKHKKCKFKNCNKQSNFNFEGELKGIYCSEHKENDMIDIINKKCKFEGCIKYPLFNFKNETKGLYCFTHKENNMIDIVNRRCEFENCTKQPLYNFEGEKPIFCSKHKKDCMIDVIYKRCKSEWCNTQIKNKYEGYCAYCFFNLYPDSPLVRNYKTKEKSVVDFVRETFKEYEWINDKRIKDGCSKRRPDLILDFCSHVIIIEIDENAHTDYDCSCENKRLMEISQDLGHRPIVFIRFNPDSYTDKDGKKIKSCWSTNKTSGILKINNKKQWKYRLECLKEQVEYWIKNKTEKTIEIIQIFYNEN